MRKSSIRVYLPFLICTALLVILGLSTLFSASLGYISKTGTPHLTLVVQLVGLVIGSLLVYLFVYDKRIDYRALYKKQYALYAFIAAVVLQLLVLTPLGVERNGASRWIDLGITTLQPSELLKIAMVLLLAGMLVGFKRTLKDFKTVIIIYGSTMGIIAILMVLIRDKGTLLISGVASIAMLLIARVRLLHILTIVLVGFASLVGLVFVADSESYAQNRIVSYLGLESNPFGADYQINQSVITIGAGKVMGKGYGESIQKHKYLPEPLTDSIFAVYAEEWGFVGSVLLILLYLAFAYCALHIARNAKDDYGRYIVVGLTILIVAQSFFNIMALIKLVPLSGMPLVFVSKGGTSLVTSLLMVAIIANVSRVSLTGRRTKKRVI